ncbi:YrrC family ATP-dependent DNA helicase [Paracoccus chinensis]|uniref:YrrC family ATP-dependent DNA helicase n=1 Tax=Paracoccus chinensis TaxID=525640 RepID=UPI003CCC3DA0
MPRPLRLVRVEHRNLVAVVSHATAISRGECISAAGQWINDRTHGLRFRAQFLKTSAPTAAEGIEKYPGPRHNLQHRPCHRQALRAPLRNGGRHHRDQPQAIAGRRGHQFCPRHWIARIVHARSDSPGTSGRVISPSVFRISAHETDRVIS